MNLSIKTRRGFLVFDFLLSLMLAVAMGVGAGWGAGVAGFCIAFGYGLAVSFIRHPAFELLGPNGQRSYVQDERQGALGVEAVAVSGMVMSVVALAGGAVELARGGLGPFGVMASIGGASFVAASLVLPRVRR